MRHGLQRLTYASSIGDFELWTSVYHTTKKCDILTGACSLVPYGKFVCKEARRRTNARSSYCRYTQRGGQNNSHIGTVGGAAAARAEDPGLQGGAGLYRSWPSYDDHWERVPNP